MKAIAILLALVAMPAAAQTVWTNTLGQSTSVACEANGEQWTEIGTICHSNKILRQNAISWSATTNVTGYIPTCPDGYETVMRGDGKVACARDIIDAR